MAIELHHLHPSHDDELTRLKARIAELERMDTEHTLQIAKMNGYIHHLEEGQRWRKVDKNFPTADDGYFFVLWEDGLPDVGYIGAEDDVIETIRDRGEGHSVEWWMPLPSAPKEAK